MHASRFSFILLFCLAGILGVSAQHIAPVTRFYPQQGKYDFYSDNYLSGFLQSAADRSNDGFLQIPFVGEPILVYVGEKDSTNFTAYASGYEMPKENNAGHLKALLTRYGIRATLTEHPAYVEQTYLYPDTTAEKGFLIDLDHAAKGTGNEDMDVVFVDRQTVRAFKRSKEGGPQAPELYYVAHFSVPFDGWNVRRERVTLKDGRKESRCKVAFTFKLKPGEPLRVESAVSATSTDMAYEALPGKLAARHFDDRRVGDEQLLAENSRPQTARSTKRKAVQEPVSAPSRSTATSPKNPQREGVVEVASRDGQLTAAFYSAVARLNQRKDMRGLTSGADWLERVALLYPEHTTSAGAEVPAETDREAVAANDTLLRHYAARALGGGEPMAGTPLAKYDADQQAAWYVLTLMGLRPETDGYRLTAPSLNVATLYMPGGRRLTLYVRRAAPTRRCVTAVRFSGTAIVAPYHLTREQVRRGGMVEVTMQE